MQPDATRTFPWPERYEFFETTRLLRTGTSDPTVRREGDGLWRTARLADGPAALRLTVQAEECIEAAAYGPGSAAALEAVPRWLGLDEAPWSLPPHPVTDALLREHPGVRLNDTGDVFEALVVSVLQQLVTWQEAAFTWRQLVEALGEEAPGPAGLRLMPTPEAIRAVSVDRLVQLGIGHQRARTLREVAYAASRLQRAADLPTPEAQHLLQQVRGVGPWTAVHALGMRLGRPEPLLLRDVNLPHTMCWALAREPHGSDARMAELLQPFPGNAFRVVRLVYAARIQAPRRKPKRRIRFRGAGR